MRLAFPNSSSNPAARGQLVSQWKVSLGLAIGLHILVLAAAAFLPSLLPRHPRLPEIYTVDLFDVAGPQSPPAPAAAPPAPAPAVTAPAAPSPPRPAPKVEPPPEKVPEKIVAKPEVPLPPETIEPVKVEVKPPETPAAPALPEKVVSLKPPKTKIKVENVEEKKRQDQLKIDRTIAELQARQEASQTQAAAEAATQKALAQISQSLLAGAASSPRAATPPTVAPSKPATAPAPSPPAAPATSVTGQGTRGTSAGAAAAASGPGIDDVRKQYHAAVLDKIKQYWVLPEFQEWDDSLEAILVVRISRDGTVLKTFFEKKSANIYFNEFVTKTMRLAEPLPPFPAELKENVIEYGLRFHPGDLM